MKTQSFRNGSVARTDDLGRSDIGQKKKQSKLNQGIYVLVISLNDGIHLKIGALGETGFKKGMYAYVGSAQTNLKQRVKRHLRKEKRKFWHIDYLLDSNAAKIIKVLYKPGSKAEECRIARILADKGEAIEGFGCSDCHCKSHFFHLGNCQFLDGFMQEIDVETWCLLSGETILEKNRG